MPPLLSLNHSPSLQINTRPVSPWDGFAAEVVWTAAGLTYMTALGEKLPQIGQKDRQTENVGKKIKEMGSRQDGKCENPLGVKHI